MPSPKRRRVRVGGYIERSVRLLLEHRPKILYDRCLDRHSEEQPRNNIRTRLLFPFPFNVFLLGYGMSSTPQKLAMSSAQCSVSHFLHVKSRQISRSSDLVRKFSLTFLDKLKRQSRRSESEVIQVIGCQRRSVVCRADLYRSLQDLCASSSNVMICRLKAQYEYAVAATSNHALTHYGVSSEPPE